MRGTFNSSSTPRLIVCIVVLCAVFINVLGVGATSANAAQIPTILSYQGRLTDSSGSLLGGSGTNYYFKFSLWDNSTVGSGTRVWPASTPTSNAHSVRQGVFNVNIGDTGNGYPDTLDIDFSKYSNLYLQVEVSSDNATFETLAPRQQVTSVPFAHVAGQVSGVAQSTFGTLTPDSGSVVTVAATTSGATPLSILGIAGQIANLFQIKNSAGAHLFSIASDGGVHASSTLSVSGLAHLYDSLFVDNGLTVGGATVLSTTTISNLTVSSLAFGNTTGILRATAGVISTGLVNLATDVTGVLGIGNGGTGLAATPAYGNLLVGTGSGYALTATSSLGVALSDTTGMLSQSRGGTGIASYAAGDILYADVSGNLTRLPVGLSGQVLKASAGGLPVWGAAASAGSTTIFAAYPLAYDTNTSVLSLDFGTTTSNTWAGTQTFGNLVATNATTTSLSIGGSYLTTLTGSGLTVSGSALTLDRTGDWTGTFGGQSGSYYLANSFSTTSANYFLSTKNTDSLAEGASNLYYTQGRFDSAFGAKTTSNLSEGSNLYYTDGRARAAISNSATGLSYNSSTGVLSVAGGYTIPLAASTTEWNTAYLNRITSANAPLSLSNNALSIAQASVSTDGYLSSLDFTSFNSRLSTTTLGLIDKGFFFSTTSASYFLAQNQGGSFSTTSANYWLTGKTTTDLAEGSNLYYTLNRFASALAGTTTDALAQGSTNKYYADSLSRAALSSTATGLSYNNSTGVFSLTAGYSIPLTASTTDWNTAYVNRITSATAPLSLSNNILSISQANGSTDGYLSSVDWNSFNSRLSTTTLGLIDKGFFFSTTSANFWKTQNDFYSTTSANYWLTTKTTTDLAEGSNLYYTINRFAGALAGTTTDALAEGGTNKYYTDARARAALSFSGTGLTYTSGTGVLSVTSGFSIPLTASTTDWNTAYLNRITAANAPLSISNNTLSISKADAGTNGYLSNTDWSTFNNKVSSTSLSALYPLQYNSGTGVFSLVFGTSTSNTWGGTQTFTNAPVLGALTGILYGNGGTLTTAATSTPALGLGLAYSGSLGSFVGGTGGSFSVSTSSFSGSGSNFNADFLDGLDSTYLLANSFSTTSANYFLSQNQGSGYSTTSANYWLTTKTTDNLTQGSTNKYYADALARAAISNIATGLTYNNTTGVFSLTSGYSIPLTASTTDWNTAYLNRITSATAPLLITSNVLSLSQASVSTDGYLSGVDYASFNSRLSTTTLGLIDKGFFFSTTSANYWKTQNDFYSTTSSNYWLTTKTTTDLTEGSNLYYTLNRFATALAGTTTDALAQGSVNKYYADSLARSALSFSGTGLTYTSATGVLSVTSGYTIPLTASTTDWNTAYLNRITSVNSPLTISNNVISINQANGSQGGYLSNIDWSTFNNKVSSTSLSALYPLQYNNGTGVFSLAFGTTTANTWNSLQIFNGGVTANALTLGSLSGVLYGNSGTVASVATSSYAVGSEFSYSGTFGSFVGGTGGTLTLATNGTPLSKLVQVGANTILGNPTGATGNVQAFATSSLGIALADTTGTLAVLRGGTGATTLNDLVTLGTHTVGNYIATIIGTANQISVSGSGSETAAVTLSLPTQLNISNASTTNVSANTAAFGGTGTTTITSTGALTTPSLSVGGLSGLLYGNSGAVSAASISSPISFSAGALSIASALADGSTKGAASFTANDFDASSGNISLDYTNGQKASGSQPGFLASADFTTFNGKVGASRVINTTYPLQGGGDLSADRTLTLAFGTTTSNTWAGTQTFTNTPVLGTLSGLVGSNSGSLYQIATSTNFVTSAVAGTGIGVSGATGAVTISNSGLLSLAQTFGSAQTGAITFATSSASTNNGVTVGLNITNSSGAFTFTPTVAVANIPNAALQNSTISGVALGSNLANLSATDSTLTFSGSYNGSAARTVGLNLASANVWTGLQSFANASSTFLSNTGTAYFGGTSTTTISANGSVTLPTAATLTVGNLSGVLHASSGVVSAGNVNLASEVTGTLPVANGGTGSTTLTGLLKGNGTGGIQTALAGTDYQTAGNYITALTGDVSASGPGSAAATLATVNGNVGSFGGSTAIPTFTVNGKGLITAAGTVAVIAPAGTLSGATLASGVTASSLTSLGTLTALTVSGNTSLAAATTTTLFSTNHLTNTFAAGQTGTTTISSTGALTTPALSIGSLSGVLYGNSGAVSSAATSSIAVSGPILYSGTLGSLVGGTGGTLSITNAAADGSTKGASTFTAADFNDNGSGLISLDYTNGQKASGSQPGFLSSADWTTFNSKQAALTFTYPLVNSANTVSLAFGTTTSNTWAGTQTFTNTPVLGTLSGLVGANNGALYQIATSTNFVTSVAAGSGIGVSGATGAVTISNNGLLSLAQTYGSAQTGAITFATSTVTANGQTLGLAITNSGGTFTFTPTISGTLNNTGLTNSSVSYGGVTVALGASNAQPAFDLTNATNLPIIAGTTGTLTVARGGTGWSTITAGAVLYGNSASALATTTAGTNGQTLALVGGIPTWVATTTAGTGLSYSAGSFNVNTTQNIAKLSNLTTNGFVKTSAGDGTLVIDTNTYLTSALTSIGPAGQLQTGPAITLASSTTGTDFTVTASGNTITFNLPSASASNRGLLSSTDWSTFNSKQAALTFTYPLVNPANTVSLAFGTTSSNTWGGTQTFTNAPVLGSLTGVLYGNSGALSAVATSSYAVGSEFSYSGTLGSLVGGTAGSLSLATNGVAYSKLAQAGANTILGNPTGGTANVQAFATSSLGIALSDTTGTLAVLRGGTGATTLNDLITLGTHTVGNYIATIAGTANQITVAGSGSETAAVTLSLPSQLNISNASTTNISANTAAFGGTGTTTISSTGALTTPSLTLGSLSGLLYGNSGAVAAASVSSPLSFSAGALSIGNAAADGSTLGAAAFNASDFNAASGVITLDYTNGQKVTTGQPGFLAAADFNTFNNKQAALTFTYPLVNSANTISIAFGTTTSNTWAGTQTFTNTPVLAALSGLVGSNSGALYQIATSTNFVTSAVAGTGIGVSGATGAVTISNSGLLSLAQTFGSAQTGAITFATSSASVSNGVTVGLNITNSTGAFTFTPTVSVSNIPNAALQNSTISGVALGGSLAALTATDSTLTFSGSYNGSTARTVGLNLGNANSWTALQQFANASSTLFSVTSKAYFGGTATTTIDSAGNVVIPTTASLTVGNATGLEYRNTGVVSTASVSSPLSFSAGTLSIGNAAADGSTLGAAAFNANDFNAASGVITLDYTNGQKATTGQPGFLASADFTTFNNKQAALTFTYPLINTTNTISLAFGTTTANNWSSLQTFNGGITTAGTVTIGTLSGLVGANSGALYQIATSTNFVTSAVAGTGIGVSGATGAVTISNNGLLSLAQTYGSAQTGAITVATSSAASSNGVTIGQTITNSSGAFTFTPTVAVANIPNAALQNSTISGIALGSNLADLTATNATLTFSGSYNGFTARTIGLNLGNANIWSALQQFNANASSTGFSSNYAAFGATATTTISSAGALNTPALTIGSLTGLLKASSGVVSAAVSSTDYAPATSGSSILYGNGAGGFSNVTVGSGLSFAGGTLSTSGSGITAIGPTGQTQSGATITIASSTSSFNGLTNAITIVGAGNTLTFTPSTSGTLTVGGGGTGQTTFTSSQLLYGNGSTALSSVATTSYAVGTEFSYSGTLGSLVGGVGGTLTLAANGTPLTKLATIAANSVLVNNTSSIGNVTSIATSSFFGAGTGGQVLTWNNGVPQWVATTTYSGSNGISTAFATGALTVSGVNAVADAATKGTATFLAADFNDNGSGTISLDYTNGQKATTGVPGFLSSADFTTFNNKQAALTFTYPLVNTTNTISLAFGTTTANNWNSLQTFNGGITTAGTVTIGTLAGLVGANNGILYQIATSTNFVTGAIAGTGIGVSGATGAVTISNNGLLSLAQTYGSAQTGAITFATSTATSFNGLTISHTITNTAGALTFGTPTITGTLTVAGGGTGQGTFTSSQLLYGNGTAGLSSVATTSVSCSGTVTCTGFNVLGASPITITGSGGGGAALIATSSSETAGQLAYWTSTSGTPATLGKIATTTLGGTGVISISNSPVLIGASPAVASLTGGSEGQVLGWSAGAPTWVATTTAGTGLTYSAGTFNVNTSQNISTLSSLTTNGVVVTSGGTGALSVDTGGLDVANGGTGATTFVNDSILTGNGTSALNPEANLTFNSTNILAVTGTVKITSATAFAFTAGRQGSTDPAFTIDASTGSSASGILLKAAATGGTTALTATDPGANSGLSINGKGTGQLSLNNLNTGAVLIGNNTGATTVNGVSVSLQTAGTARLSIVGTTVGVASTTPWRTFSVVGAVAINGLASSGDTLPICINNTTKEIIARATAACSVGSDARLKENVLPLSTQYGLSAIETLRPVSFDYRDPSFGVGHQQGFIAQEVAPIFPDLVGTSTPTALTPDVTYTLNYQGFVVPTIKALQELAKGYSIAHPGSGATTIASSYTGTNSSAITVADSGNVGIGKSAPNYLLDVNGTAAAKAFIVTDLGGISLPSSVLSSGGVDLYKFATYNYAAIIQLASRADLAATRLDALEARVALLEARTTATSSTLAAGAGLPGLDVIQGGDTTTVLSFLIGHKTELATTTNATVFTGRLAAGLDVVSPFGAFDGLTVNTLGSEGSTLNVLSDTVFIGRPFLNNDTAGHAVIHAGERTVQITFDRPYIAQPVVSASVAIEDTGESASAEDAADQYFHHDLAYVIVAKSLNGFTIVLNKKAMDDVRFDWTAFAVKNPKIFQSQAQQPSEPEPTPDAASSTPPDSGSSTPPEPVGGGDTPPPPDVTPPPVPTPPVPDLPPPPVDIPPVPTP